MPFPINERSRERREALLCLIYLMGRPHYEMPSVETYNPLAEFFALTEAEREQRILDGTNRRYWDNLIQNSRQDLVESGLIDKSDRAIWRLTEKGLEEARSLVESNPSLYQRLNRSLRYPINVEDQDLTDDEIDAALRANRLRIGIVVTDSQVAQVRRRKGQDRIRKLTLENYGGCCAVCDVMDSALLVASHIVGWAEGPEHRGDLTNVICLCRMHDALFEAGYWSLGDRLELLKRTASSHTIRQLLEGMISFRLPLAHSPAPRFSKHHREQFQFRYEEE